MADVLRELLTDRLAHLDVGLADRSLAAANPPMSGAVSRSQTITFEPMTKL
jgi:hypothetical protein